MLLYHGYLHWRQETNTFTYQYDGEKGMTKTLDVLYDEFKRVMQLAGCKSVAEISKASIGIARPDGPLARL